MSPSQPTRAGTRTRTILSRLGTGRSAHADRNKSATNRKRFCAELPSANPLLPRTHHYLLTHTGLGTPTSGTTPRYWRRFGRVMIPPVPHKWCRRSYAFDHDRSWSCGDDKWDLSSSCNTSLYDSPHDAGVVGEPPLTRRVFCYRTPP